MDPGIRVDLHLHTNCSDGVCTPAVMAERLAAAGVTHAAITDHNNFDAQEPFRRAFDLHGGVAITGLETCARFEDQLVHLLVYGFDLMDRHIRSLVEGALPLEKALEVIHEGQGLAVLAHPLQFWSQREDLDRVLGLMKGLGLDGLEARYKPYSPEQQQMLLDLADEHGLLVSAGSDYHGNAINGGIEPGVDVDLSHWQQFRNGLSVFRMASEDRVADQGAESRLSSGRPDWRWLALRIIVPAIVTVGLFVGATFGLILPAFEQNLLDRKRETIRELTNSAWSILEGYAKEVSQGRLSESEARQMAIERIRFMRYGSQGKDYFWITDMQPVMIMHPYRTDLEGQDVTDFRDPRGVRLFVEFVKAVRERQHDYVGYVWQWKDDPERMAPKESYVRLFEPWGWIIGTGLYTDDVHAEIAAHERRLIDLSLVIIGLITLLLLSMVVQSVRIERHRSVASLQLRESHEKYRALIEATTEGNLMLMGRRCAYANQAMLEMIGYSGQELPLLDVHDLFPAEEDSPFPTTTRFEAMAGQGGAGGQVQARMRRKDGSCIDVVLSVSRIAVAGRQALVVTARDLRFHNELEARMGESLGQYRAVANRIRFGVFRAAEEGGWHIVEANPPACLMMGVGEPGSDQTVLLEEIFPHDQQREALLQRLVAEESVEDFRLTLRHADGDEQEVLVSLSLVRGSDGRARFCDGTMRIAGSGGGVVDGESADLLSQLDAALEFLNEPARTIMQPLVVCPMNTPIDRAAQRLTRRRDVALAVTGRGDAVVGIVTEHELSSRVVAEGHETSQPVHEIMSSPVVLLSDKALAYEALVLMQQNDGRPVVIQDARGHPLGLVRAERLSRFRYYAPAVLSRERSSTLSAGHWSRQRSEMLEAVGGMIKNQREPRRMVRAITSGFDAAAGRLITLAMQDMGPPPLPFAFLAFGSIGRQEQTLVTDQDSAIVYQDPAPEQAEAVAEYFLLLGRRLCDDLRVAGYPFCTGDVMASSPQRNLPMSGWKEAFGRWIRLPESRNLVEFAICFDFRCVFGDNHLADELRNYVHRTLGQEPAFFFHLARNCLQHGVPLGLFGQIVTGAGEGQQANTVDFKRAMLPVVNFARLYALRMSCEATNTISRLEALADSDVIRRDTAGQLIEVYEFLMLLRLRHQVAALAAGREADNLVSPAELSESEHASLKKKFSTIALIQKKIGLDFPGAA